MRDLFKESFYCNGKHHAIITALPIPVFLETLNLKEDKQYRVFVNEYFCKIMDFETDKNITFFSYQYSKFSRYFSDEDLHIPSCPICNSKMKLRNSQYGMFWGCSHYPNCKVKLQIAVINEN